MKAELYILRPEDGIVPKAYDITKVKLKEVALDKSYEDYVQPAILWATEDTESLARALDVEKVIAKGSYIMGLFGGEKRSGNEPYAGLVVISSRPAGGGLYVKLHNTEKEYQVPSDLRRYGVDIYKMYYISRINPFKCSTYDVILSSKGENKLKEFLTDIIKINKNVMTEGDERKLRKLIDELKAQVNTLSSNSYYVVYRGKRVFSACVPEDLSKTVSESNTAYIECRSAEQAYYYAAILNYLAYKAINEGRGFLRNQYAKPLLAIVVANLTWKDLPPQLRGEIAKLSHTLSEKLTWIDYPNQKKAILEIAKTHEFAKIIELLDKHIESASKQSMLEGALELVSSVKQEENDEDD